MLTKNCHKALIEPEHNLKREFPHFKQTTIPISIRFRGRGSVIFDSIPFHIYLISILCFLIGIQWIYLNKQLRC